MGRSCSDGASSDFDNIWPLPVYGKEKEYMMLLGEETKISLMDEGPNLAYVLADDGDFASVQYLSLIHI